MKVNMNILSAKKKFKYARQSGVVCRLIVFLLIELVIVYESVYPSIKLDENQWLYISTMMPQVLAALLGLSFAGYQFYGNMLQNMIAKDYTIKDSVEYGKKSVFRNMKFISIVTGMDIMFSVISILLFDTYQCKNLQITVNIIFNNSVVLFLYIVYYFIKIVLRLTDPKFVEISSNEGAEAEKIIQNEKNEKLDYKDELYQYGIFMREFGNMENVLRTASNNMAKKNNVRIYNGVMNLPKRIEIIKMYRGDLIPILNEVSQLIRFRNYLVHGTEKAGVTKELNNKVKRIAHELQNSLKKELEIIK